MTCIFFYLINTILMIFITSVYFKSTYGLHRIEWMIYLVMFISGCIRAFLAPSSFSLLPLLVKREDISQAVTWSSTSWMLGSVLGPLFGGLLMAWVGVHTTIMVSFAGLFFAFFALVPFSALYICDRTCCSFCFIILNKALQAFTTIFAYLLT